MSSSTRNKRKRPEPIVDPPPAPSGRRKSRDSRAALPATADPAMDTHEEEQDEEPKKPLHETTTIEDTSKASTKSDSSPSTGTLNGNPTTKKSETASQKPPSATASETNDKKGVSSVKDGTKEEETMSTSTNRRTPSSTTADTTTTTTTTATSKSNEGSSSSQNDEKQAKTSQPQHVSNANASGSNITTSTSQMDPNPDSDQRRVQIQQLIRHRAMLVSRIRLCRGAADKRIQETIKTSAMSSQSTAAGGTSTGMTDEEEIQAHKEMSRVAAIAAKKVRDGEAAASGTTPPAEKRTSLSLRRGSSVGKRMNAALSSLAPGVASSSGGGGESSTSPKSGGKSGGAAKAQNPSHLSTTQSSSAAATLSVSATTANSSRPAASKSTTPRPKSQPTTSTKTSGSDSIRTNMTSASNPKAFSSGAGLAARATMPVSSSTASTMRSGAASMSSHTMQRLPERQQPRVHYPEAQRLREERNKLIMKLQALMEKGKDTRQRSASEIRRGFHHRESIALQNWEEGERMQDATWLPKRRKTHWDRLLREMKWAASDFIEERKWKLACASTISQGIEASILAKAKPQEKSPAAKLAAAAAAAASNGQDSQQPIGRTDEEGDAMEIDPTSDTKSLEAPISVPPNTYAEPTAEDQASARQVATKTSKLIERIATKAQAPPATPHVVAAENKPNDCGQEETTKPEEGASKEVGSESTASKTKSLSFGEITTMVDELSQVKKQDLSRKGTSYQVGNESIKLTRGQERILNFIESMWNMTPGVGALIKSLPISGITMAICALLFDRQDRGPQLIVCQPKSMLRWAKTISDFPKIKPIIFASDQEKELSWAQDSIFSPQAGDVVICEASMVESLLSVCPKSKMLFEVVCLDCRQPLSDIREFETISWWNTLNTLVSGHSRQRLLLEDAKVNEAVLNTTLTAMREKLEVMSMRFAFLLGSRRLKSNGGPSMAKLIIQWARQKEKRNAEKKHERVHRILSESIETMSYSADQITPEKKPKLSYETRLCQMSSEQKMDYALRCEELRGVCSWSLEECLNFDPKEPRASLFSALQDLRHSCLASRSFLQKMHSKFPIQNGRKRLEVNASQPDLTTASDLIQSSGKLKELVRVLISHLEYGVADKDGLQSLFKGKLFERSSGQKTAKVGKSQHTIIFAALPIARYLISLLLSCLGITHELLEGAESIDRMFSISQLENASAGSTIKMESSISIVSSASFERMSHSNRIEAIGTIIFIDEDWSGNEHNLIDSALRRWIIGMSFTKNQGELIRIVCKRSIEESLFSSNQILSSKKDAPKKDQRADYLESDFFQFSLLDLKDISLSEVLNLKSIGVDFLSGTSLKFLSSTKEELEHSSSTTHYESDSSKFIAKLSVFEKKDAMTATRYDDGQSTSHFGRSTCKLSSTPIRTFFDGQVRGFGNHSSAEQSRQSLRLQAPPRVIKSAPAARSHLSQIEETQQLSSEIPVGSSSKIEPLDALGYTLRESPQSCIISKSGQSNFLPGFVPPSKTIPDGNQGAEALPFLPPLHGVLNFNLVDEVQKSTPVDQTPSTKAGGDDLSTRKRKILEGVAPTPVQAKKTRGDTPSPNGPSIDQGLANSIALSTGQHGTSDSTVNTRQPAAVEAIDQQVPKVVGSLDSDSRDMLFESMVLINDSIDVQTSQLSNDQPGTNSSKHLDLMAIFVRKDSRHGGYQQQATRMQPVGNTGPQYTAGRDPTSMKPGPKEIDGENGKKARRKSLTQSVGNAVRRMSNQGLKPPMPASVALLNQPLTSETLRHRMLSSFAARQFGTGLSMFESTSFRAASTEVERRLVVRLMHLLLSNTYQESGLGLPSFLVNILQRGLQYHHSKPRGASQGASSNPRGSPAKEYAAYRRASLRRSLNAPCRVDFGPFDSGFLSLPSGMTAVAPPRTRLGVSLPMGVKVPLSHRDQPDAFWTKDDDDLLKDAAVRFGLNWTIVAKVLSSEQNIPSTKDGHARSKKQRSARQCRDRWQQLVRNEPSLAGKVRKNEKILRENLLKRRNEFLVKTTSPASTLIKHEASGVHLLLKPSVKNLEAEKAPEKAGKNEEKIAQMAENVAAEIQNNSILPPIQKKRRLSMLSQANKRRQIIPIAIPGISPDGKVNQPVPSHPSHMQSVQSSMASKWSNGRTEMWPLQILDCADKFYASKSESEEQRRLESKTPGPSSNGAFRHQNPPQRPADRSPAPTHRVPQHRAPSSPLRRAKNPGDATSRSE